MSSRRIRPEERNLREEIRFHLEERARELEAQGMSSEEAIRRAREAFGDPEVVVARVRRDAERDGEGGRAARIATELVRDVRYALRRLARSPGFALVATLTLALGIGANTAIFSLAEAVFFRAPPVRDSGELVAVYTTCRLGDPRCSSSFPDYLDYRADSPLLADLAAVASTSVSMGDDGRGAELLSGMQVTGNYFELLGLAPAAGRLLQPADGVPGDPRAVAVLSWDAWQRLFGGDRAVVGRTMRLNTTPFEIVGVAPRGFRGTALTDHPDLFIPITAGGLLRIGTERWDEQLAARGTRWIDVLVGRLRPGATAAGLQAEMRALDARLNERYPDDRGTRAITVDAAPRYMLPQVGAEALSRLVAVLAAVVGATLLLACANLANLLLARATGREQEMGVRLSLGAGRARLLRQLFTEALVLAGAGAAAGLLVARALLAGLTRYELPGRVGLDALGVGLDGRVLAFTAASALATALMFGLAPALHAARSDLAGAVKATRSRGARGARVRNALVSVQIALCLVLLMGAGLFLRSLRHGLDYELGFRPERVALAHLHPGVAGYGRADGAALVERVLARVRGLPGVVDASVSTAVPLGLGSYLGYFAEVPGYQPAPDEEMRVELIYATPGFFRALGLSVRAGRGIEEGDMTSPPVAFVNREMATRYWDGAPVGRPVEIAGLERTVAGVIDDLAWRSLPQPPINVLVAPLTVEVGHGSLILAVRTDSDARAILPSLRREIQALDPTVPVSVLETLDDRIGSALAAQRMGAAVLSAFALLALALAATGIAGVVAYTVSQGRRDIGVRLALGASRASVIRGVAAGVAGPVLIGLVMGAVVSLALGGAIRAFLLDVVPADPITMAGVTAALLAVATAAALVPARRASRVDPVEALRSE